MAPESTPNVGSAFDSVQKVDSPVANYADELARELSRYQALGRTEAGQHRPPTDATSLDQHESALLAEAHRFLALQRNFLDFSLSRAIKALNTVNQRLIHWKTKCEMTLADRSLAMAVDTELSDCREKLVKLTERRLRSDVALRAFRARQSIPLDEEARYPTSLWWHFGLVAVLGLVETGANATFYQNDQGFLGGFTIALSVAVLNLGMAIGLGWLSRYKNLGETDKRVMGWAAIGFFCLWTVFSNALFASFRAEYQAVVSESSAGLAAAFTRSWQNALGVFSFSLHLTDFQSFILFGLGLLLSVLAFWKGLTSDDKYPGHRRLDMQSASDRANEQRALDEASDKLRSFLRSKQADAQSTLTEVPLIVASIVATEGELSQAGALYEAWQQAIMRDFGMVLTAYRQANVAIRATDPPAYFGTTPELTVSPCGAVFDQTRLQLAELRERATALRAQLDDAIQAKIQEVMAESRSARSEGVSAFRASINAEAQERINRDLQTLDRLPA